MLTIKDVRKTAKQLNAIVRYEPDWQDICLYVEAPQGHVWDDGPVHELCSSVPNFANEDMKRLKHELFDDAISRMNFGLSKCEEPDCEWCNS